MKEVKKLGGGDDDAEISKKQFIRFARPGSRLGGWISAVDQSFGHATLCPLEGGQMPQPQPGTNCRCVAARPLGRGVNFLAV